MEEKIEQWDEVGVKVEEGMVVEEVVEEMEVEVEVMVVVVEMGVVVVLMVEVRVQMEMTVMEEVL